MVEIGDKLISLDVFEKRFVCDLSACKGACCVEGDNGAPLEDEEIDIIEDNLDAIKPYMRKEGLDAIAKSGVFYMDQDNEPVTTLVNDRECAFVFFDENNITKCSIEEAYTNGKTNIKKPISCHLYPIRVSKLRNYLAVNYSHWNICSDACKLGAALNVKTFRFLKEPIIRKWGEEFYQEMERVDQELEKGKEN
jgi:hypothetical protein